MSAPVYTEIVHYSGHVQGVGFRYTTLQIAREFPVVGEVKNLPDGRVRLIAQGEKLDVQAFRTELEERMRSYIREVEATPEPASAPYSSFEITH